MLGSRVFFVASQDPLLPVLCVGANRTISIGTTKCSREHCRQFLRRLHVEWFDTIDGRMAGECAWGEQDRRSACRICRSMSGCLTGTYLIPSVANVIVSPGDLVADDMGRTAVITGSELTDLGWRIYAKLAIT